MHYLLSLAWEPRLLMLLQSFVRQWLLDEQLLDHKGFYIIVATKIGWFVTAWSLNCTRNRYKQGLRTAGTYKASSSARKTTIDVKTVLAMCSRANNINLTYHVTTYHSKIFQ